MDATEPSPAVSTPSLKRMTLFAIAATAAGLGLAILGGTDAHASEGEGLGLLDGLVDTVEAVESPVGATVSGVVDGSVNGLTDTVSSVVHAVAPPVASITDPVIAGVTEPVVQAVTSVVEVKPLTSVTGSVAATANTIVASTPIVSDVVDAVTTIVPSTPAGPNDAVPSPATDESPSVGEGTATEGEQPIDIAAHAAGSLSSTQWTLPGEKTPRVALPDGGADGVLIDADEEPRHPLHSPAVGSNSIAGASAHHGHTHADLHGQAMTVLHTGFSAVSGDEKPPGAPSFDSDSRPD